MYVRMLARLIIIVDERSSFWATHVRPERVPVLTKDISEDFRNFESKSDSSSSSSSSSSTAAQCGRRFGFPKIRIVGGSEAAIGQFPWQARILAKRTSSSSNFRLQCGGTLISPNMILSASHCFKSTDVNRYRVELGYHSSNDTCGVQKFLVKKIVTHPDFGRNTLHNDIAIIIIESEFGQSAFFTQRVFPACLPHDVIISEGEAGTVSGWGLLEEGGSETSDALNFVTVPITSDDECVNAYSGIATIKADMQICAGNDLGQDACSGDSGIYPKSNLYNMYSMNHKYSHDHCRLLIIL